MRKLIYLLIIIAVIVAALVGCNGKNKEKDYSLSIGVVVNHDAAKANVTETVATLVTDADGKIVICRLDCVDYTVGYTAEGALKTTAPKSKVVLGDAYAMDAGSWAKQGAALENHVKGKTQAEVASIAVDGG